MEKSKLLVIIEKVIAPQSLNKIQRIVLEESWEGRSYQEISDQYDYELGYIKDTGAELWKLLSKTIGQTVTKKNLRGTLRQLEQSPPSSQRIYWGEAIDVGDFYGRAQELEQLQQWMGEDRRRLVGLFAFGGMGKTALSVKIAQTMAEQFEAVVWQSLRDTPPLEELLPPLLRFLVNDPSANIPESLGGQLSTLIHCLQRRRSLLVLDNFDSLFAPTQPAGVFRPGYEKYGELLTRLGTINHQSCILVTSREEPLEFGALIGENQPVRRLQLTGLDYGAGQKLLENQGAEVTLEKCEQLIEHCHGNPLTLKIFATAIRDLFENDIDSFWAENITFLSGIEPVIDQQINRLSVLEKSLLFWLAIERKPITFSALSALLFPSVTGSRVVTALESLQRRSLVESSRVGFTLQPVVMEFMTEKLIKTITAEILAEKLIIFRSHALMKATSQDYIRESQTRLILRPILDSLATTLDGQSALPTALSRLIPILRRDYGSESNYSAANIIHLLRELNVDLTGYDFSYLTLRQAYLQDINLRGVDLSYGELKDCIFAETFGGITDVAFSPDGKQLATCDTLGELQIWDSHQFQKLAYCRGHSNWVWSLCFHPQSALLVSGGQDQTVRVWDATTGYCLQVLRGHQGIVTSVAFSADGEWIASAGQDQTVRLWRLKTGALSQTLRGHEGCVWSARFTLDGRSVLSSSEDGTIRRWNLETGDCEKIFSGHEHWVWGLAVHPGGRRFASSSFDRTVKLWDLETGACLQTLRGHTQPVTAVAFAPDGQTLASSSYDQTVRLWQVEGGNCVEVLKKHTSLVWSVAFDPQGRRLASGGDDHGACLWQLDSGYGSVCAKVLQGYSNSVYSVAFSPDARQIASAHESQVISLWRQQEGGERFEFARALRGHRGRVLSAVFSPDGEQVISGSCDHTVKIWDAGAGKCLQTLSGHRSWIWSVALSADGTLIASGSYDHTVKLWERETGNCLGTLIGHPSCVLSVKFSPDGHYLASGGYDQTINIWRVASQSCETTLTAHSNRVWSADFSGDGQLLATGGDDGAVKIWDWRQGRCLQTLTGHSGQVLSVFWSADGETLFSSGGDQTIKVWNWQTGADLHTLRGHQNLVSSLQEDWERRWLLSGGNDETVKIWRQSDFEGQPCHQTLHIVRPYEGMKIPHLRNLTEAQRATLLALGAVETDSLGSALL